MPQGPLQTGYGERQSVRIITVDKDRMRVECALRDGGMVYAAVWDLPMIFRWPKTGEVWYIRKDGGIWRLDALVQDANAPNQAPLSDLKEGEARVNAEVLRDAMGSRFVTGQSLNVIDFGAVGDGSDDSEAIAAAEEAVRAGEGSSVFYPAGTYGISVPLSGDVSHIGAGEQETTIKALTALGSATNKMILDLGVNYYKEGHEFRNMAFDANNVAGVQCVGSNEGDQGNAINIFERVLFMNTVDNVWAVGGLGSGPAGVGLFCGTLFRGCLWQECAHAVFMSINSDDTHFDGCRFKMKAAPANNNFGPYIQIYGGNITLSNTWVQLGSTGWFPNTLSSFMFAFGSGSIQIDNISFEGTGVVTDLAYLIYTDFAPVVWQGGRFGSINPATELPSLVALLHESVDHGIPNIYLQCKVSNLMIVNTFASVPVIEAGLDTGAPAAGVKLNYVFDDIDAWPSPMVVTGDNSSIKSVYLLGNHHGHSYVGGTNKALWTANRGIRAIGSESEDLILVRGVIDSSGSGSILKGSGFGITRNGTGDVTVTFSSGTFSDTPAISFGCTSDGSAQGPMVTFRNGTTPSASGFRAQVVLISTGTADAVFHFTAVGPT